jgi:hypothetical protein
MRLVEPREPRGGNCLPLEEKEQEMRNIFRIIGVSLVSMAGILLVSGVAWAQATKTPVSGTSDFLRSRGGEEWTDEEGVLHQRNTADRVRYHEDTEEGGIDGIQLAIGNLNIGDIDFDQKTGEGDQYGSFTFVGYVLGDLVTARGRYSGVCGGQPSMCEIDGVWHLSDGGLLKTTEVGPLFGPNADWVYVGMILDPPGQR